MDDLSDIRQLYNAGWDAEAARLQRHQLEVEITWRYLNRYLPSNGRILEVGCGTGFYTFALARRGYQMTAIDLADEFVARCKAMAQDLDLSDQIDFRVGDARTLRGVPCEAFDAVLLMGPLYHLVLETDRLAAVRSAYACLKPGGVIVSALISRLGILGYLLRDNPSWIENRKSVWSHIQNGHRPPDAPPDGFRGYFARLDEIAPMHEAVGFHTAQIAGVEPAISADDKSFNGLEGSQRDRWVDLLFDVSADQSMVASSRHIVYVGHKPAA